MPTILTAIKFKKIINFYRLTEQYCRIRSDLDPELSLRIRIRPGEKVSNITVIQVIVLSAEFIQFIMFVGSLKKNYHSEL
jgi:hypothetical protein